MARISFKYNRKNYYINIDFNDIVRDITNHYYTPAKCYTNSKTYYLAVITWHNHCIEIFPYVYDNIVDNIINFEPINKKPIYDFKIE